MHLGLDASPDKKELVFMNKKTLISAAVLLVLLASACQLSTFFPAAAPTVRRGSHPSRLNLSPTFPPRRTN